MNRLTTCVLAFCLLSLPLQASAAPAEVRKKPNVLFITSDDLGCYLGTYGDKVVKTPNLDRLAARGVRFDRAYCQLPLCGPSRASIMTGMRPQTVGVITNGPTVRAKIPDVVTLPQLFRNHGYVAARVGKIYHLGIPGGVGTSGPDDPQSWDHTFNPKGEEFIKPRDQWLAKGEEVNPDPTYGQGFRRVIIDGDGREQADYQAADEAIRLLNEHKGRPFFLALGFVRPHVPVVAPRKYFEMYDLADIQLPQVPPNDRDDIPPTAWHREQPWWGMDETESRESIRAYYASISFMDAQVGRVLDELERLGLADDTVVAFLGDHGYLLGQHATWQKMVLFEESARAPLIIAAPGAGERGAGTRSIVEFIDVYPTVAELAGLPVPQAVEGRSLVPVLNDPAATVRDAAYTQLQRRRATQGRSVRTDRWRYTEWTGEGAGAELYDHASDPNEWTNLATDPQHAATVKEMKALLDQGPPPLPLRPADAATSRRARQR